MAEVAAAEVAADGIAAAGFDAFDVTAADVAAVKVALSPKTRPVVDIFRGTGIARRTGGRPKSEYVQKRRPSIRKKIKPSVEIILDLGARLGDCRRCTCPVHEADITDGYAEKCDDAFGGFECLQASYASSCSDYAKEHPEAVQAAAAAGLILIITDVDLPPAPTEAAEMETAAAEPPAATEPLAADERDDEAPLAAEAPPTVE